MDTLLVDLERLEDERDRARDELADRHEERIDEIMKYSASTQNGTLIVFDDLICSDAINKHKTTAIIWA